MKRKNEVWEAQGPHEHPNAFYSMPVVIAMKYEDEQGRRVTEYLCEFNAKVPNARAIAERICELMNAEPA